MQPTALLFLLFICYFIWIVIKYKRENKPHVTDGKGTLNVL